jgi:hypothetical protein
MRAKRQFKPLRRFEYSLVAERMDGLLINIDRDLQRRGLRATQSGNHNADRCYMLLNLIVRFAQNSYDAVRYVAGNTPEDSRRRPNYALVVPTINRQVLDLLFSLVYMLDDFSVRSLQYQRAGWRELNEEYHLFKSHFSRDPAWTQHFKNVKGELTKMVSRFGIADKERKNPKLVPFWKHPFELKDEKTESRPFLRYLEKWLYADTSAQAHLSFGGLIMVAPFLVAGIVGGQDEEWITGRTMRQYHFKHFSRTAIVTLAIATEIDCYCQLGNEKVAGYLWNIFGEYAAEAKEMLKQRYEKVLAGGACVIPNTIK